MIYCVCFKYILRLLLLLLKKGPMEDSSNLAPMSVLEQVQHYHLTQALQGLLPPTIDAHKLKQVLDLNCQIGAWAIDLALAYPGVVVTGLDSDSRAIDVARRNTGAGSIKNVLFYEADLREMLSLREDTFDLVHLFTSQPLLRPGEWPSLLQECMRVMKPGATINLVYKIFGPGSSDAYQRCFVLIDQLFRTTGLSFSDKPGTFAQGVYFCRLLQQAGFTASNYIIRPVDLGGWNNPGGRACSRLWLKKLLELKKLFIQLDMISSEELDELIVQTEKDIGEVDFCATAALISVFATKS